MVGRAIDEPKYTRSAISADLRARGCVLKNKRSTETIWRAIYSLWERIGTAYMAEHGKDKLPEPTIPAPYIELRGRLNVETAARPDL